MKTIKGPAIFLAQFAADTPPFNSLAGMAGWAASHGYTGIQIPTWDARLFDLDKAASSRAYCDEVKGTLAAHGLAVTELATHLQATSSRSTRSTTPSSTASPPRPCVASPRPAPAGPWSRSKPRRRPVATWGSTRW